VTHGAQLNIRAWEVRDVGEETLIYAGTFEGFRPFAYAAQS
jgi:hypothetical protein